MKIAVTYEDGNVFQHFGHTEYFKIYEAVNGEIVSSEVIPSNGFGHGALAGLLAGYDIDMLICGGMGSGAQRALAEAGIEVCTGVTGDADEAVKKWLNGELISAGVNCDHHHGEEHSCHDGGCGGSCGSQCGSGCGGGCGESAGGNRGMICRVHYRGTLDDGTQFDSSYDRGEPLEFVCGGGMMIPGFDNAVAEMKVGESVDIHLTPAEAYGEADPNAVFTVPLDRLPGAEKVNVGQQVMLTGGDGQQYSAYVTAKDETTITFDMNHPMAGKALNFHIELISME